MNLRDLAFLGQRLRRNNLSKMFLLLRLQYVRVSDFSMCKSIDLSVNQNCDNWCRLSRCSIFIATLLNDYTDEKVGFDIF